MAKFLTRRRKNIRRYRQHPIFLSTHPRLDVAHSGNKSRFRRAVNARAVQQSPVEQHNGTRLGFEIDRRRQFANASAATRLDQCFVGTRNYQGAAVFVVDVLRNEHGVHQRRGLGGYPWQQRPLIDMQTLGITTRVCAIGEKAMTNPALTQTLVE